MIEMGVLGDDEMTAKSFHPVFGSAKEIGFFLMFRSIVAMLVSAHVVLFWSFGVVENGGVITAMKIHVCFGEEVVGEQAAGIPEEHFEDAILAALAPNGRLGLED